MLKKWENLPEKMKTPEVRKYYNMLEKKRAYLIIKRIFDFSVSLIMLIVFSPVFLIISLAIVTTSKGGVYFRQKRITTYGKTFRIHKFRTMVAGADKKGPLVTVGGDKRITRVGRFLRKYRLDELPQLIDILEGNMSFVGTRPEVKKYVDRYTPEMYATLLMPAGVTSEASIKYKDEDRILEAADDIEDAYVNLVLPEKMKYNLYYIRKSGIIKDIALLVKTVFAVLFR